MRANQFQFQPPFQSESIVDSNSQAIPTQPIFTCSLYLRSEQENSGRTRFSHRQSSSDMNKYTNRRCSIV
ncbi:hypothetical protein VTI28DRAFT_537 [Corynascus sepedonium]